MAHVDWYIEGRSFGNCNCAYSCPCQFEELPTHGDCKGFDIVEVDKGNFGDTDLVGLRAATIYTFPGPVFEGGGTMQVVIDERANEAQREALKTVLHGGETDEAKTHWWVYHAMCDTVLKTLYRPLEFEVDIESRKARVSIPGILEAAGRPIQAPHGGGEHRVRIDIPGGIEFSIAEIGNASAKATGGVKFDNRNSYGQWTLLRHGPHGVVA